MVIKVKEIIKEWLETIEPLFELKINCEWCDSELPKDNDPCEWDGYYFCDEDCLAEYLEDGE